MRVVERSLALCENGQKEGSEGGRETREEAAAWVQPEGEAVGLMEKKGQVLSDCVLKLGSLSAWHFQMYETLDSHLLTATLLAC